MPGVACFDARTLLFQLANVVSLSANTMTGQTLKVSKTFRVSIERRVNDGNSHFIR